MSFDAERPRPFFVERMQYMAIWDQRTPEDVIMYVAMTQGYLNEAITHYGARISWAEAGNTHIGNRLTFEQMQALVPQFAASAADLINRDMIEVREPLDGNWDDAPQLSRAEIDAVLADPATWLQSPDTHENIRMIWVLTTDHADRLIAERTPAPGGDSLRAYGAGAAQAAAFPSLTSEA
ncbi:hypothetical protein ABH920_007260 [Catenulispora sp. EB89]|uniref:hypothetical protein n=1 Tax=Catenulispora sp. EB89 TaxID=3156257 RepID=UPI0035156529